MQKTDGADNQQETATEIEKAWLAGLIDGEGSFIAPNPNHWAGGIRLIITNTHHRMIEHAAEIARKIGTGPRIAARDGHTRKGVPCNRTWDLQIIGFKRLKIFIPAILPYLIGKHDEALTMYRLVESRLSKGNLNDLPNAARCYDEYELSLVESLRNGSLRPQSVPTGSPETIRRAPKL